MALVLLLVHMLVLLLVIGFALGTVHAIVCVPVSVDAQSLPISKEVLSGRPVIIFNIGQYHSTQFSTEEYFPLVLFPHATLESPVTPPLLSNPRV